MEGKEEEREEEMKKITCSFCEKFTGLMVDFEKLTGHLVSVVCKSCGAENRFCNVMKKGSVDDSLLSKEDCQMKLKALQMIMEDVMKKKDLALKKDIRHLFADCTTDWGTTDFEMFGEKVLEFISKK